MYHYTHIVPMKTTINVDDELMAQAMRLYDVKTKTRIIEMGLHALIDADRRRRLHDAFGSQPELDRAPRRRFP